MRSFVQVATIFSAATVALTIRPTSHVHQDFKLDHIGAGTPYQHENGINDLPLPTSSGISVFFSVPCEACFANADEELEIEMKIDPSELACQISSVTLNDVKLSTQSSILFKANTSRGSNPSEVLASWQTTCLEDEVTLMTVRIDEILGTSRIQQGSGFSTSFKQGRSPTFLRLEQSPIGDITSPGNTKKWLKPQDDADFVVVGALSNIDAQLPSELQEQMKRLHHIKAQMGRLQHKYMRQEQQIFRMITKDFHTCDGAGCLFQTAIKKAPDFFELVKAHFKHHPDWTKLRGHRSHDHQRPPQIVEFDADRDMHHPTGSPVGVFGDSEDRAGHFPGSTDTDRLSPPPPVDEGRPSPPPHHGAPHPPPHHEGCHDGPPPPPHFDEDGILIPPPPPCHHRGGPGHKNGGHHKPQHHPPHSFHAYGPHRHPFYFSLGSILVFAVIASLLFKCVRSKTGLFSNQKRQRDRAARREECCNRAAYRRAALRHKWRRYWSYFRQPESTTDYEEKRARLLCQEDALEDVMQSEIRDLRRAHEIVGEMMRAEEGRQRLYHDANFGSLSQPVQTAQGLERQNTAGNELNASMLPEYQPPPPSYDQELEGELTVVDGFSYTPSATDSTPDSSVVDCNSRMSFETNTTIIKS